ncbi:MAG: hypothetical protein U1F52_20280 [Burkholderiales bacterium]
MEWRKLGRIFCAEGQNDWMFSHAMIPVAERIEADLWRVYFSPRDRRNRGHGAWLDIDMRRPTRVERLCERPVLEPGALGCFDDSGALPNSLVTVGGRKRLYYTGINLGVTVKIRNAIGLAEWNEASERFERLFEGPVIDRTREHPHFVATPEVHYDGRYRAWFTSCVRWTEEAEGPKHHYRLEYAESEDGIVWDRPGTVAVDFRDAHEYALGVPRVIRDGDLHRMWFCSRATASYPTYRIRYAESHDGRQWIRRDEIVGIDVGAGDAWDAEMICYPFVFDHGGDRYMLYNGNGYGRTGFGIAVLERE